MTSSERLWTGLAVSLFAHFLLVTTRFAPSCPTPTSDAFIDMDTTSVIASDTGQAGVGIDTYAPPTPRAQDLADQRRQAFLKYLDAVDEAVHARRPDVPGSRLLGVAVYGFAVRGDGTFTEPSLKASSGDAGLDAAASRAIRAASGAVKRPPILGTGIIPVVVHVKYQYDLK